MLVVVVVDFLWSPKKLPCDRRSTLSLTDSVLGACGSADAIIFGIVSRVGVSSSSASAESSSSSIMNRTPYTSSSVAAPIATGCLNRLVGLSTCPYWVNGMVAVADLNSLLALVEVLRKCVPA